MLSYVLIKLDTFFKPKPFFREKCWLRFNCYFLLKLHFTCTFIRSSSFIKDLRLGWEMHRPLPSYFLPEIGRRRVLANQGMLYETGK